MIIKNGEEHKIVISKINPDVKLSLVFAQNKTNAHKEFTERLKEIYIAEFIKKQSCK